MGWFYASQEAERRGGGGVWGFWGARGQVQDSEISLGTSARLVAFGLDLVSVDSS